MRWVREKVRGPCALPVHRLVKNKPGGVEVNLWAEGIVDTWVSAGQNELRFAGYFVCIYKAAVVAAFSDPREWDCFRVSRI